MQGTVLSAGSDYNLILGDDGIRYSWVTEAWKNGDMIPEVGVRVDFEVRDSQALEIYPLPSELPPSPAPPPPVPPTDSTAPTGQAPDEATAESVVEDPAESSREVLDGEGGPGKLSSFYGVVQKWIGGLAVIIIGIVFVAFSFFARTDIFELVLDYVGIVGVAAGLVVALVGVFMLGREKAWWGKTDASAGDVGNAAQSSDRTASPTESMSNDGDNGSQAA